MNLRKEPVHGFTVIFDKDFRKGIDYLRDDLQREEAKVIFYSARRNKNAEFEDDHDRDWTLIYNEGEGTYTLIKRERE